MVCELGEDCVNSQTDRFLKTFLKENDVASAVEAVEVAPIGELGGDLEV